jgi:hypothetical protein
VKWCWKSTIIAASSAEKTRRLLSACSAKQVARIVRSEIRERSTGSNADPGFRYCSIQATVTPMSNFMSYVGVPIAIGAVAVVLILGLVNMMRGGSGNTSQKLMRLRVLLQFIAIVVIMFTVWVMSK